MKLCVCVCLIALYCLCACNGSDVNSVLDQKSTDSRTRFIDLVIEDLENEQWEKDEKNCYDKTIDILVNARNFTLWATWVWDSNQLPVGVLYGSRYHLGHFDECMKPPWEEPRLQLQYCLADVKLYPSKPYRRRLSDADFDPYKSIEPFLSVMREYQQDLSTITWGVCLPAACARHSTAKFLRVLLKNSHLGPFTIKPNITVDPCQVAGEPHKHSIGYKLFWYMLLSLITMTICSTIFANNTTAESDIIRIVKAFCIKKNGQQLVKELRGDIKVMHGMRALTAILLVISHQVAYQSYAVFNLFDFNKAMEIVRYLSHTDVLVDTFFMMSALLLVKCLASKQENPFVTITKRYIRLAGPFAVIVFYMNIVSEMGSGPLWPRKMGYEQATCSKNWLLGLLMLNNYINVEEICYEVSWYIAADFHLTILGVFLYQLHRRHRRVGLAAFIMTAVLGVVVPGITNYINRLPPILVYDFPSLLSFRDSKVFVSSYTLSHNRVGVYLIGMAAGYLLAFYKPAHNKDIISKKWSAIVFWMCFLVSLTQFLGPPVLQKFNYTPLQGAIMEVLKRILWAAGLVGGILVCEYGEPPLTKSLLSWTAWVPLSGLSFGVYLVHPAVIFHHIYGARTPLYFSEMNTIIYWLGTVVVSYILSLLIWLLVQAPLNNLTNFKATKNPTYDSVNKKL